MAKESSNRSEKDERWESCGEDLRGRRRRRIKDLEKGTGKRNGEDLGERKKKKKKKKKVGVVRRKRC